MAPGRSAWRERSRQLDRRQHLAFGPDPATTTRAHPAVFGARGCRGSAARHSEPGSPPTVDVTCGRLGSHRLWPAPPPTSPRTALAPRPPGHPDHEDRRWNSPSATSRSSPWTQREQRQALTSAGREGADAALGTRPTRRVEHVDLSTPGYDTRDWRRRQVGSTPAERWTGQVLRRAKRSTYWARWRSPRNSSWTRARPAAPSRSARSPSSNRRAIAAARASRS
jgi:hypothetical protein